MRVLALVPNLYDTSPAQRFRVEQWEPHLRRQGIEFSFHPFEDNRLHALLPTSGNLGRKLRSVMQAFGRRAHLMRTVRDYDVVYICREAALLGPPVLERYIRGAGVPYVYDFDDAIWIPDINPSSGYLSLLKMPAKTRTLCRLAAHVLPGNQYLADYAGQVNDHVTVIPTTIDTDKYTIDPHKTSADPPVIGWSGSRTTVKYLDTLRNALQRLAKSERFRLRVIGTPQYELEGVDVEALPWRSASEISDLRPMDIGLMPLPDDLWARGKCGLKALQYMALGIPAVCSPVGVNSDIIHDGENGMLAASENEWIDKLPLLLRDADLRRRLGTAGRATVDEGYSAAAQAPRVGQILESVAAGRARD
jgi:glycosyltransferase involved in cell wall biosynthesis